MRKEARGWAGSDEDCEDTRGVVTEDILSHAVTCIKAAAHYNQGIRGCLKSEGRSCQS